MAEHRTVLATTLLEEPLGPSESARYDAPLLPEPFLQRELASASEIDLTGPGISAPVDVVRGAYLPTWVANLEPDWYEILWDWLRPGLLNVPHGWSSKGGRFPEASFEPVGVRFGWPEMVPEPYAESLGLEAYVLEGYEFPIPHDDSWVAEAKEKEAAEKAAEEEARRLRDHMLKENKENPFVIKLPPLRPLDPGDPEFDWSPVPAAWFWLSLRSKEFEPEPMEVPDTTAFFLPQPRIDTGGDGEDDPDEKSDFTWHRFKDSWGDDGNGLEPWEKGK